MAKDKGADVFVVSKDPESLKANAYSIDVILNTVSAEHDAMTYLSLLKKGGTLVQLGGVPTPQPISQMPLMFNRWSIAGSLIGGIKETQECIDFCHAHKIYPEIELCEAKHLDDIWHKLQKEGNSGGLRYVLDIKKSLENKEFLPK